MTRGTGGRLAFACQELKFVPAPAALIFKKGHTLFYRRLLTRGHRPSAISAQHSAWCRVALSALAFRVVSALVGALAVLKIPLGAPPQWSLSGRANAFWDQFTRYDAGWYYQIARYGYWFVPGGPSAGVGKPGKIAYFPLYPFTAGYVGRLFGSSAAAPYLGGIVVSWVAFAAAMVVLFELARLDLDETGARRAVILIAVFPFSFFFGMVYTESLFLLLTLLAFYAFRRHQWIAGGFAGACATATRVNGILMLPALAVTAWQQRSSAPRDRVRAFVGLLLVGGGIAAYSFYVYRLSGNPFEWVVSITGWNYHPTGPPWVAPVRLIQRLVTEPRHYFRTDPMAAYDTLYGLTGIAFAAATPVVWYRLGAAYGLFMLVNLWLPLSSGVFEGVGRYCSVLFPFFVWLASTRSRAVFAVVVAGSLLLYAVALAMFVTLRPLF